MKPGQLKIASILLWVHGLIEILGGVTLLTLPPELLTVTVPWAGRELVFMAMISAISGGFRLFIGYGVWLMRKWGAVLGIIFCAVTMVAAPQIFPFGIMDIIFATVILVLLVTAWFGKEMLVK